MGKKKNREMLFAIAGISTLVDAQLYVVTERRQFFHSLPSIVVNSSCFSPAPRAFAIFSVHFYVYRYPFFFFLYLFYFYILHSHHFFDIIDYRHICSSDKVLSSQLYFIRFRQICLSHFRYLSGLTPTFIIEPLKICPAMPIQAKKKPCYCKGGALSSGLCSQRPFTAEAQNARWQ